MVRSLMAGDTNYSSQTLAEMSADLKGWISLLRKTSEKLNKTISQLKASGYWDKKVYHGFQDLILHCIAVYDRSRVEIEEVLPDLEEEIESHHVARLRTIGSTAIELNHNLGQTWNRDYPERLMDYGNPDFRKVESLYGVARDTAADMMDLTNLASRLTDFIGKKTKSEAIKEKPEDVLEVKPNFFGVGLNLNAVYRKLFKKKIST